MKRISLVVAIIIFSVISAFAQPYIEDIREFKKQDSISFPPKRQTCLLVVPH
jgi:hypothetical protein